METYSHWWKEDKSRTAEAVFSTVHEINLATSSRQDNNLKMMKMYGNYNHAGVTPYSYQSSAGGLPADRIKLNIISSMCDTASAKLGKARPKITFLTSGGDFSAQEQAKKLEKFVQGQFSGTKLYAIGAQAMRDSTIFDVGCIKSYRDGRKIISERVFPNEIYIDPVDGMYGQPSHMHQVKYILRDTLLAQYPKFKGAIELATTKLDPSEYVDNAKQDRVVVIESWHLDSGPEAGDGKHTICISSAVLFEEEYEKDYFPFVFFRWSERLLGFFGQSLAERISGIQVEVNKMLQVIQKSFHLGSSFKIFLEKGSKVIKEHLTNAEGSIVEYVGTKPDYTVPQTVHPEYFQHLERLIQRAYEQEGISQLSAQSVKPGGLDSGVALRTYQDIESERFVLISQRFEEAYIEFAKQYIELAKEISEDEEEGYKVKFYDRKFGIEDISWDDVKLEEDMYVLQLYPTNILPSTPAGKLAFVSDMMNMQIFDQTVARSLLNFPDTEAEMELLNAPFNNIKSTIQTMLEGEYESPEPFQDLALGIKMVMSAYNKAKNDKAPEDVLENLRTWLRAANVMLNGPDKAPVDATQQALPPAAPAVDPAALPPALPPI